jgi:DNA-binding winged helix-turn-helix (wHTH) protein
MKTNTNLVPASRHVRRPPDDASRSSTATADASFEFGHFRVLLRRRQVLADGVRVEVGGRAFDLLVTLLEADGRLVTKEELVRRVWPGIVVSEENLKVQVAALRRALGADRDLIRTEYGRGYRFTGIPQAKAEPHVCQRRTPVERRSQTWRQPLRCGFCWS